MILLIHGKNIPITAPLRTQVERKLRFALDRVMHRVHTVRVRLDDINGPRGGVDKRCVIHIRGDRGWVFRTEYVARDTLAALSAAVERLERMIEREVSRRRDREMADRPRRFAS